MFLLTALFACSSQDRSVLKIYYNLAFRLEEGEVAVTVDSRARDTFDFYFDTLNVQIPLFRQIGAEGYDIFIGMPFNTEIERIGEIVLEERYTLEYSEDTAGLVYKKYSSEKEAVVIYAEEFHGNKLFLMVVGNKGALSDSIFSLPSLNNRFIQKAMNSFLTKVQINPDRLKAILYKAANL